MMMRHSPRSQARSADSRANHTHGCCRSAGRSRLPDYLPAGDLPFDLLVLSALCELSLPFDAAYAKWLQLTQKGRRGILVDAEYDAALAAAHDVTHRDYLNTAPQIHRRADAYRTAAHCATQRIPQTQSKWETRKEAEGL